MYGFAQSWLPSDLLAGCACGAWSPSPCPACSEGISAPPGVEPFPPVATAQGQAPLLGHVKPPPFPGPGGGCLRLLQVLECFGGTAVAQAGRSSAWTLSTLC